MEEMLVSSVRFIKPPEYYDMIPADRAAEKSYLHGSIKKADFQGMGCGMCGAEIHFPKRSGCFDRR